MPRKEDTDENVQSRDDILRSVGAPVDPKSEEATSSASEGAVATATAEPSVRTHTVESGDTLWAIAEKYYGDGNQYPKIFGANRDQLDNPDLIHPGQELKIPE